MVFGVVYEEVFVHLRSVPRNRLRGEAGGSLHTAVEQLPAEGGVPVWGNGEVTSSWHVPCHRRQGRRGGPARGPGHDVGVSRGTEVLLQHRRHRQGFRHRSRMRSWQDFLGRRILRRSGHVLPGTQQFSDLQEVGPYSRRVTQEPATHLWIGGLLNCWEYTKRKNFIFKVVHTLALTHWRRNQ